MRAEFNFSLAMRQACNVSAMAVEGKARLQKEWDSIEVEQVIRVIPKAAS